MRERLRVREVDEEIFAEGQKLPRGREPRTLSERGPQNVEAKHDEVRWQNPERTAKVELSKRRPISLRVRSQQLSADEEAAQNKEEVDAYPAILRGGGAGPRIAHGVEPHHDEDGEGPQCVKAGPVGGWRLLHGANRRAARPGARTSPASSPAASSRR